MGLHVKKLLVLALVLFAAGVASVAAQTYPSRPVRLIVPFAPGGPTDVFARLIAQKMSEQTGKQFYVENVGGAGGNAGHGRAAQAAPDGYTILVTGGSHVNNPFLYNHVPYDPIKDFDAVTLAVDSAVVLTVHPSVPAQSVKDLVALIRASAGKFSYASPGTGTPPQLVGALFRAVARSRPRARAIQRRRPGDRLHGCGPHADLLRRDGPGRTVGQGWPVACARGHVEGANAGVARCSDHGGGWLSRGGGQQLDRRGGAGGYLEGDHRACSIA